MSKKWYEFTCKCGDNYFIYLTEQEYRKKDHQKECLALSCKKKKRGRKKKE